MDDQRIVLNVLQQLEKHDDIEIVINVVDIINDVIIINLEEVYDEIDQDIEKEKEVNISIIVIPKVNKIKRKVNR